MKKLLTSVLVLTLFFSLPALADKEAKVKELLKVQKYDKLINSLINKLLFVPVECTFIVPETAKSDLRKELLSVMNLKELTDPMIQFTMDRYTEEELDEIIRFYKTKAGQKSIKMQEEGTIFMTQHLHKWEKQIMPEVEKLAKKIEQEYPKRSGNEVQACIQKYQN